MAVVYLTLCLKSLHFVQLFHYTNSWKPSFFTLPCLIFLLVMYVLDVKVIQAKLLPCSVGFWLTLCLVLSLKLSTCIYNSLYCVFELQISPLCYCAKSWCLPAEHHHCCPNVLGQCLLQLQCLKLGVAHPWSIKKEVFCLDFDPPTLFRFWGKPCPSMGVWTMAIVQQSEIQIAKGKAKNLGIDMA